MDNNLNERWRHWPTTLRSRSYSEKARISLTFTVVYSFWKKNKDTTCVWQAGTIELQYANYDTLPLHVFIPMPEIVVNCVSILHATCFVTFCCFSILKNICLLWINSLLTIAQGRSNSDIFPETDEQILLLANAHQRGVIQFASCRAFTELLSACSRERITAKTLFEETRYCVSKRCIAKKKF